MRRAAFLIALLLWPVFATADAAEVSIVVQEMPGLIEPGRDLPYSKLLSALLKDAPVAAPVSILPGYRGLGEWLRHKYRCIFGGVSAPGHRRPLNTSLSDEDWQSLKIARPFNLLKVRAVTTDDQSAPKSKADLEGRQIGIDQILYFDLSFHTDSLKGASFNKVATADAALDLLARGRVELVLAYDNDVALYQVGHPESALAYAPQLTLLELEESMMCWPGPGVDDFIAHIDGVIDQMAKSGQLTKLVGPGSR